MTHAGASPHWESMWGGGLPKGAAFDVGSTSNALLHELKSLPKPPAGSVALVPGCGRAYDALALALHGFDRVVAVDLAPTAVKAAQAELMASAGDPAALKKVEVVCADFFDFGGGETFDFIWDCTFLCALDPAVRTRWAEKQKSLLAPEGTLLTCIFPICKKTGGPPYAMSVPLVTDLLAPAGFRAVRTHECGPGEAHNPGGVASLGGPGTTLVAWAHGA